MMNPFHLHPSVPSKYVISLPDKAGLDSTSDLGLEKRYVLAAHISWVRELISTKKIPPTFPVHDKLQEDEVFAFLCQGKLSPFENNWIFLLVTVIKCPKKVESFVDLDEIVTPGLSKAKAKGNMTWPELVDFIGESNFNYIWEQPQITLMGRKLEAEQDRNKYIKMETNQYLHKLIKKIYLDQDGGGGQDASLSEDTQRLRVSNLSQPLAVIVAQTTQNLREEETECFFIFHHFQCFNVFDVVTFSPQKLMSTSKQMLILYQILNFLRDFEALGIPIWNMTLRDIQVDECLYISVVPSLPRIMERLKGSDDLAEISFAEPLVLKMMEWIVKKVRGWDAGLKPEGVQVDIKFVEAVIRHWCEGLIPNFDYLMFLNFLCGRFCNGNPNFHPVFPWVSDLSSPNGGWRDFTKSKFRLNKGDRQLDIMYEETTSDNAIPHHVTDILSEITYYVYKARRTPKEVLCRFVRRNWVPAEYPGSISRMQSWTPDECIPEFYDQPEIFKSIHEDLPDLKVPKWCTSPEEFIKQHRRMLESDFVSAKLHHWIDLTFGYKLSGTGAVKSKNVYLSLVDSHQHLESHGVVQLFQTAHPPRRSPLRDLRNSVTYRELKKLRELEDSDQPPEANTVDSKSKQWKNISPPKHYDPMGFFNDFEVTVNFFRTHFPYLKEPSIALTGLKNHEDIPDHVKVFGCLLLEILLPQKFRHVSCVQSITQKFDAYKDIIKPCIHLAPLFCRRAVQAIFDRSSLEFTIPIDLSLDVLLLGERVGPIPFPRYFSDVNKLLRTIRNYEKVLLTASPEDSSYRTRLQELKVQSFARDLMQILEHLDPEGIITDIILSFITDMFDHHETRVLAVWNLFCPIAKAIGKKKSEEHLLQPILDIYKADYHSGKHLKLFHKTFLLQLSSCFGLRVFLENFSTLLVEAIGGWKVSGEQHESILRTHLKSDDFDDDNSSSSQTQPLKKQERETFHSTSASSRATQDSFVRSESDGGDASSTQAYEPEMFVMEPDMSDSESGDNGYVASDSVTVSDVIPVTAAVFFSEPPIRSSRNQSPHQSTHKRSREGSATRSSSVSSSGSKSVLAISDVCFESILSIAHRLGPVLTAKYFSKNLLRMLTLCYLDHLELMESVSATLSCDGDLHAAKVLDCLMAISDLYGDAFIERQYIPYCSDIIKSAKHKVTPNVESALVGVATILERIFQTIPDTMLMSQLQDPIIKRILAPLAELFCSPSTEFPSGWIPRALLASKCASMMTSVRKKIGPDLSQLHLKPVIFTLCSAFKCVYSDSKGKVEAEMTNAFDPALAASIFTNFGDVVTGSEYESLIRDLYLKHGLSSSSETTRGEDGAFSDNLNQKRRVDQQSSFGSRSFGNRIQVQELEPPAEEQASTPIFTKKDTTRHLRGNWLVYWDHEIGRSDCKFNFKQIKLHTFTGHTGSVRCIYSLNNENSFLTASKDKTVKLWSLRNQGDESGISSCQWTYSYHKKAVLSVVFQEALHLAASTDGFIHIWDPFVGKLIRILDKGASAKNGTVCALRPILNTSQFVGAGTDSTIHVVDFRTCHAFELKIGVGPTSGLVRCLAVTDNGQTVAVGHSSGIVSTLDLRNGTLLGSWKGHDGEVLQLVPHRNKQVISSSFDQNICVWNLDENKLAFNLRGITEPVHSMSTFDSELISCTTSNRIGIHCGIDSNADFSSTRLKSDTFKGVVTSMRLLPLNQLLLLGSEAGNVTLLC